MMRALTLWRPWPWAILHAGKRVENRGWKPPAWILGEPVALHAGKKLDLEALEDMRDGLYGESAMRAPDEHPMGVVGVVRFSGHSTDSIDPWASPGAIAWHISEVIDLPEPIACRGEQGLWVLPQDIEAEVQRQLADAESLDRRRDRLLEEEKNQPMAVWWLSFADKNGSLGVCLVEARGFMRAVSIAHALGINPGGEVQGVEVPPTEQEWRLPRNRLLSPPDLRELGYRTVREHEDENNG